MPARTTDHIPGVEIRRNETTQRWEQEIICARDSSHRLWVGRPASGRTHYPPEGVHAIARGRGWRPDRSGKHLCPACLEAAHQRPERPTSIAQSILGTKGARSQKTRDPNTPRTTAFERQAVLDGLAYQRMPGTDRVVTSMEKWEAERRILLAWLQDARDGLG